MKVVCSAPMAASSSHGRLGLEVSGASWARLLVVLGSRLISESTPRSTPRASDVLSAVHVHIVCNVGRKFPWEGGLVRGRHLRVGIDYFQFMQSFSPDQIL